MPITILYTSPTVSENNLQINTESKSASKPSTMFIPYYCLLHHHTALRRLHNPSSYSSHTYSPLSSLPIRQPGLLHRKRSRRAIYGSLPICHRLRFCLWSFGAGCFRSCLSRILIRKDESLIDLMLNFARTRCMYMYVMSAYKYGIFLFFK